jgi:hypothetical protein
MIRNLKVLGLALVAMLAMTAVAASAASADDLTSETSPVTLTGKQAGLGDVFTTTAGTVKCKEVNYTATNVATPTTTVNAVPSYPEKTTSGEQNCTGFGFPATVATNGCTYRFTIGGATTGGLDIICTGGQEITVTAVGAGTVKCIVHVGSQNLAAGITYSNTGAGTTREIKIAANLAKTLTYKHTAGTGVGACSPGGSSTEGSYTGEGIVTGENGGTHVGIFLS